MIAALPDVISDDTKDKTSTSKAVLASTTGLFVLETLASRVTRIIQLQQTDLKLDGVIGDVITNYATKYSFGLLQISFQY